MFNKKSKKQVKQYVDPNPIEALRDIGTSTLDQLFGKGTYSEKPKTGSVKGDLSVGQEIDLSQQKTPQKESQAATNLEPAYDYRREILYGEKGSQRENSKVIEMQIQEIIIELKKLASSSKELQVQFKEITVEKMPENPGKYHLNFFEWLLATMRTARERVEEAASWLSMFSSKKKKKQYWSMFKKHGTTFGLSNERVVSTQTG